MQSVSRRAICLDNCTCCHTETEVADQLSHPATEWLTQGKPVLAMTLYGKAIGRVATREPTRDSWKRPLDFPQWRRMLHHWATEKV